MKLKILSWIGALSFFASMLGLFVLVRNTMPSLLLLIFLFITFVGGGILAIWANNGKFPNRFIVFALVAGYLNFLFLGFGRITNIPEDSASHFFNGLLMAVIVIIFAYIGLKEHEK